MLPDATRRIDQIAASANVIGKYGITQNRLATPDCERCMAQGNDFDQLATRLMETRISQSEAESCSRELICLFTDSGNKSE